MDRNLVLSGSGVFGKLQKSPTVSEIDIEELDLELTISSDYITMK